MYILIIVFIVNGAVALLGIQLILLNAWLREKLQTEPTELEKWLENQTEGE